MNVKYFSKWLSSCFQRASNKGQDPKGGKSHWQNLGAEVAEREREKKKERKRERELHTHTKSLANHLGT